MSGKTARVYISGFGEIEISSDKYRRLKKMAERTPEFYGLNNGIVIGLRHLAAVFPGAADLEDLGPTPAVIQTPVKPEGADGGVEGAENTGEGSGDVVKITPQQIKNVMEEHNLSVNALAKEVGYSTATVRMAVKGDRISDDFSAAMMNKYFNPKEDEEPKAGPEPEPTDEVGNAYDGQG